MLFLSIMHHYFIWHYTRAFLEIFHVWLNLIWFVVNFFSLPQLMRSWLAPWKRMVEDRGEKWNLEALAGFVIINIFSRIVGGIMRTAIIAIGLVVLFITLLGGLVIYVFWIFAPVIIIALLTFGISLLIA